MAKRKVPFAKTRDGQQAAKGNFTGKVSNAVKPGSRTSMPKPLAKDARSRRLEMFSQNERGEQKKVKYVGRKDSRNTKGSSIGKNQTLTARGQAAARRNDIKALSKGGLGQNQSRAGMRAYQDRLAKGLRKGEDEVTAKRRALKAGRRGAGLRLAEG